MATFIDRKHVLNKSIKRIPLGEARAQNAILGFQGPTRYLSNFTRSNVMMYSVAFPTVEHAYQAAKMQPNDLVRSREEYLRELKEFAQIPTPGKAKSAGRAMKLREGWEDMKFDVMLKLVERKFENKLLAIKLIETGEVPIYELNDHHDRIFGTVMDGGDMVGQNWLGEILMHVRSNLA